MNKTYELWGQIGATFHLTDEEMETLLNFDEYAEKLFASLILDQRYEVDDQFYAPECKDGHDLYISLTGIEKRDSVWSGRNDQDLYPRKIWCRMGIVLSLDKQQLQTLKKEDEASAKPVISLMESGRYRVEGSCLFESGNELEGYDEPDGYRYLDVFNTDGSHPEMTPSPQDGRNEFETGIKFY